MQFANVCVLCSSAALLQQQWEALALRLGQTQEQIRARESALVFAFVEVKSTTYGIFTEIEDCESIWGHVVRLCVRACVCV